ncbi:hypothetical protein [Methylosinus sp. sav-2]|uniref:hypothetical protein n=1 Tax=Methylosinus sp. sav-2 TaxID=2485168 RepID=UPI0012F6E0E9|nr:hypothetical protein [Methylosinus sp. sav-2]
MDELETVERSSSGSSTKSTNYWRERRVWQSAVTLPNATAGRASLDFVWDQIRRSRRETLRPAFDAGDFARIGERVAFGVVHEGGEPWERRPELIGDVAANRLSGAFVHPQRRGPLCPHSILTTDVASDDI